MALFSMPFQGEPEIMNPSTWKGIQEMFSLATSLTVTTYNQWSQQICPPSFTNPMCQRLLSGGGGRPPSSRCLKVHFNAIQESLRSKKRVNYQCHLGLSNCAIPIMIGQIPYGVVETGQAFVNQPSKETFYYLGLEGYEWEQIFEFAKALPIIDEVKFLSYSNLLTTIVLSVANERHQKLEETKRAKRLSFIAELSRRVGEPLTTLLSFIATKMTEVSEMEKCTIFLLNHEAGEMVGAASSLLSQEELKTLRFKVSGEYDNIVLEEEPFVSSDAESDPRLIKEYVVKCQIKSILTIPLKVREKIIGVIHLVNSRSHHFFTPEEVQFINALAAEVSLVIESTFLEEDRRRRAALLDRYREEIQSYFTQIGKALSSALNIDSLLYLIADLSMKAVRADACSLFLIQDGVIEKRVVIGLNQEMEHTVQLLIDENAAVWVNEHNYSFHKQPLRISPLPISHLEHSSQSQEIKSLLRIPLRIQDHLVGLLNIYLKEEKEFSQQEIEILSAFASQGTLALENVRLFHEEQRKAREMALLYEAAKTISSDRTLEAILHHIAGEMTRLTGVNRCLIFLIDSVHKTLNSVEVYGVTLEEREFFNALAIPLHFLEGEDWHNFMNGQPLTLNESSQEAPALKHVLGIFNMKSCLIAPLLSEKRLIGMVYLDDFFVAHDFTDAQVSIAMALSLMAATTIERAQLYHQLEEHIKQIKTLYQLSTSLSGSLNLSRIMNLIIEKMAVLTKKNKCCLFLWDEYKKEFTVKAAKNLSEEFIKKAIARLEDKFVSLAAQRKRPVYSANVLLETDSPQLAKLIKKEGLGAVLSVPLISKKKIIGVITAFADLGYQFSEEEIHLLFNFANHAALCIENARLYATIKEKVHELGSLFEVGKSISSTLKFSEVLKEMTDQFTYVMRADACSIMLIDDTGHLAVKAARGITKKSIFHKRIKFGEGVVGKVAKTNQPQVLLDASSGEKEDSKFPSQLREEGIASLLAVPLATKTRRLGVVNIYCKSHREFSSQEINLLATLAGQGAVALENARLFEEQYAIAQMLQTSLMPASRPRFPDLEIGHKFLSSKEVSGDYFDFIEHGKDKLGITIADVSGKGTGAAIYTARGKYVWKAYAMEDYEPNKVLTRLNELLVPETPLDKFISMFYGVLDLKNKEFIYSNAGHEPPILYKSSTKTCKFLNTEGLLIGVEKKASFSKKKVPVKSGDVIVFYTDGVTEARDAQGNIFGTGRLQDVVKGSATLSAQSIANKIFADVQRYSKTPSLNDDFTLVVLKIK